jgi:DNA-binding MarR family transcriptional regulator
MALWTGCSRDTYAERHWPGEPEHLVFVPASGDLHLLTPPAIAVLNLLSAEPTSVEELAERIDLPGATVTDVLQSLERLGLVTERL